MCSIVALGRYPRIGHAREGSRRAISEGCDERTVASTQEGDELDALFARVRHSCGAGRSVRAMKAKERSSGEGAPTRAVDGAPWGKPVQDRHCPATVTPSGVAPAAKSDYPTRRVRRPSRERERTLYGALAAPDSP
jgi:hypothetical protein